jgi:hypothetical protein
MRACDLLKTSLTPEQQGAVHQILFENTQIFLDARVGIGPLAEAAFYVLERTPLNDQDEFEHMDGAKQLSKRLLRAPQDCVKILEEMWP